MEDRASGDVAARTSAVTENQKAVPPPTKKELEELKRDYIVQCTKVSLAHLYIMTSGRGT